MARKPRTPKQVASLKHKEAKRTNIPTAEYQSVMQKEAKAPVKVSYPRGAHGLDAEKDQRNRDLDPQLVWRGKDSQDWSDLVVNAPPLYIQEKVGPKALIDELMRESRDHPSRHSRGAAADHPSPSRGGAGGGDGLGAGEPRDQPDLFGDFNGLPEGADKTDFYHYEGNWQNRMILGDSLQVMASLAEREGLRGKVQCIYLDPPYGIKFNSNFQWSTTSRDVKDGNAEHITREPEQVKAFRDTWRDGIHSYLTYLRDRLTVARDLLAESGSIFVQIGDENVHRVRAVMDEVFGDDNFVSQIFVQKSGGFASGRLDNIGDYILWYARDTARLKFRPLLDNKANAKSGMSNYPNLMLGSYEERLLNKEERDGVISLPKGAKLFGVHSITSARTLGGGDTKSFPFEGKIYTPGNNTFKTDSGGLQVLNKSGRFRATAKRLGYVRFFDDFAAVTINNNWSDTRGDMGMIYVVQTSTKIIERCILMATDPGDLVLDPTCGSGTTAYVAEQWGRRWTTIDTSRVALALARARIMGARYPYYLLADSKEGQLKEAEVTRSVPKSTPTYGNIGLGFVYERVPPITLKSIANHTEIDVIWDRFRQTLEPLQQQLNQALGRTPVGAGPARDASGGRARGALLREWQEWEIPREADAKWRGAAKKLHAEWWRQRIARQREIDASIAAKADFENLYDKPYEDGGKVRVAGPFTVESLSPHRVLGVDEHGNPVDSDQWSVVKDQPPHDFAAMILENLRTAGMQQAHKDGRISFTSLVPWPGRLVCAEGRFDSDQWLESSGQCSVTSDRNGRERSEHNEHNPPTTGHQPLATEKRAAIFIGHEFGTVSRPDLVDAAREAGDAATGAGPQPRPLEHRKRPLPDRLELCRGPQPDPQRPWPGQCDPPAPLRCGPAQALPKAGAAYRRDDAPTRAPTSPGTRLPETDGQLSRDWPQPGVRTNLPCVQSASQLPRLVDASYTGQRCSKRAMCVWHPLRLCPTTHQIGMRSFAAGLGSRTTPSCEKHSKASTR
ncbi:MAG: site-specific DNA-methyltransferase [Rhodanobacteraceae bacterium]